MRGLRGFALHPPLSSTAKRDFSSQKALGEEEVLAALEMTARRTVEKRRILKWLQQSRRCNRILRLDRQNY